MNLEAKLRHYRLTESEYGEIKKHLGREPSQIEWALFSALWSEHCSYKSSKVHLRKLFTKHPRVVQGPGENAGVIDLGKGERVAFKMESHNHPSFIEPTQGAATGVGGILRDIFTMGARPIASMDYLCFGETKHPLTPRLLQGVVNGIGGYGNCVGVPTVNGQTTFHSSYNGNILVNAFNLGLFRPGDEVFYGRAEGPGNLIVYVGACTGRDGVHGAAMASESFDSDVEKKKPNVQIGDPFFEKLLIEGCLEVMKEKLVVGIQDMGAAGLTSSTFEMASRAGSGLKIDLKKVPLREPDITPEDILLSETQERMVMIVEPPNFKRVEEVFNRWDLSCVCIGEITSGELVELWWGDECLTKISHRPLVENAPVYERPFDLPKPNPGSKIEPLKKENLAQKFLEWLKLPEVGSRLWISRQYDQRVGAKTIMGCDDGVGLLRLPDSGRVLGMAVGCRPSLMSWDTLSGARDAIALPVLQLASRGVKALAVTDCLNFGNPEKSQVMGEFVAAIRGMNEACVEFDTPIISGNVSLYNETLGESIVGTPATGIVGLRESLHGPKGFLNEEGLDIYLVETADRSLWVDGFLPGQGKTNIDLKQTKILQELFLKLAPLAEASQVVGRGGIAFSLMKLSRHSIGVEITEQFRPEELFACRFYSGLWAVRNEKTADFERVALSHPEHVIFKKVGRSRKGRFDISDIIRLDLLEVLKTYEGAFGGLVERMA